jgi:nucleoside-diphosphate-sugar epimerase
MIAAPSLNIHGFDERRMLPPTIAIIGAGGFVGSRLTESLVLAGHEGVRPVIRHHRNLAGLCRYGNAIDVRLADAESLAALRPALAGCHTVVNLLTGVPAGIVRSTEAIYQACVDSGVTRLIHMSSAVVFGDVERPRADDDPPLDKHWMAYARAKGTSEVWLRQRLGGPVDVAVLRPGVVWGARSSHTLQFAAALSGKRAFLVDGGRGIFNGIYVDNLVAAILAVAAHPESAAGFYNVGDRERVTWADFFAGLGAPLGCDVARLAQVSRTRFPHSTRSVIDAIQALPVVNDLYHRLKPRIPDDVKTTLKGLLEGTAGYERPASTYASAPFVDREFWHLQRVAHKLPIDKFCTTFRTEPPITFAEGMRRTAIWLESIGMTSTARTVDCRP